MFYVWAFEGRSFSNNKNDSCHTHLSSHLSGRQILQHSASFPPYLKCFGMHLNTRSVSREAAFVRGGGGDLPWWTYAPLLFHNKTIVFSGVVMMVVWTKTTKNVTPHTTPVFKTRLMSVSCLIDTRTQSYANERWLCPHTGGGISAFRWTPLPLPLSCIDDVKVFPSPSYLWKLSSAPWARLSAQASYLSPSLSYFNLRLNVFDEAKARNRI